MVINYSYLNNLSDEIKEEASLNIIFISDGASNGNSYDEILSNLENLGVNIYTFAYNLDETNDKTAYDTLKDVSTNDSVTSITSANIDEILNTFVDAVTVSNPAGTGATLTDNVGASFSIDANSSDLITINGNSVGNSETFDITDNEHYLGTSETFSAYNGQEVTLTEDQKNAKLNELEGYELSSDNVYTRVIDKNEPNIINVLYIMKDLSFDDESVNKTTQTSEITSESDEVNYQIKYNVTANNVRVGDIITVTITDNLPYEIDTTNLEKLSDTTYKLSDGIYDSEAKTITWTFTETSNQYYEEYKIEKTIDFSVVYKDFANISSSDDNKLTNNVTGITTINNKSTDGTSDETDVVVKINGKVKAVYLEKDNEENILAEEENSEGLVGSKYTTEEKEIFGYTLDSDPDNKEGNYDTEEIVVKYLYKKNKGTITPPVVVKEGPTYVTSINSIFNYTLKVQTTIEKYVGDAKLVVVDTLPYEVDRNESTIDRRCSYTGEKEITCIVEYKDIKEEDYEEGKYNIDEEFDLQLVFINIDKNKVTNEVNAEILLDNNSDEGNHSVTTEVEQGKVIVNYITTDGEKIIDSITLTDNAGSKYTTEAKEFGGYTLIDNPENAEGVYIADETIIVDYIYSKNIGTGVYIYLEF